MINQEFLPGIVIGLGVGLLLALAAVYGHRRGRISRLTLILLTPLLVLIPVSWPLAGALSYDGRMEQLRCAFVVVIPLSVAAWLLARVAGWDWEASEEEE